MSGTGRKGAVIEAGFGLPPVPEVAVEPAEMTPEQAALLDLLGRVARVERLLGLRPVIGKGVWNG